MQDTLGAGTTSEKELCDVLLAEHTILANAAGIETSFRHKILSRSCFEAQGCEVLPSILHKIQDSIRFKRRHHVSVCAAQLSHWLRCPWPQDSLPVHPVGDWWLEINAWLETCRINRIDLCNHTLKRCCWWPSRSWILKKSLRQIIWSVLIISSMSITFCVIWGIQPLRRFVMFCVQWEASSSIISKPLITQKDINELRKAQKKNSRKLDKHAQTSSSGFAKEYTRFQFIVQCLPGLEWDHEGKTCWINIPPETPTAWLVLSRFN